MVRNPQTWVMSFLYIGTFGSFIGYSAAMPLLIKLNFWVPDPAPLGTGIYFAYYAFLGALVGSLDPAARRLAGRQVRRREGHPGRVRRDDRVHARGAVDRHPADAEPDRRRRRSRPTTSRGSRGSSASSCCVFAATGIGNGSTYRMIPAIFRTAAERATDAEHPRARGRAATGDQAVVGGDRHHRRGRRARRLPRSRSRSARRGSTTRCRRPRARSWCSPASTSSARVGHLRSSTSRRPRRSATSLARRGHLTVTDDDPLPLLRPAVRDDARAHRGRALRGARRGRSSRSTRARCAARAGRPPGCAATASG